MYKSPIKIEYEEITPKINDNIDRLVITAVLKTGVTVDKDELLKALNYDRGQYEAGYKDGYIEGYKKAFDEAREILHKTLNDTFGEYLKKEGLDNGNK